MIKTFYKLILALNDNKLLQIRGKYIIGYNMHFKNYVIWYVDASNIPKIFQTCDSLLNLNFVLDILIS